MGYDFVKQGAQNLKSIGFGAAMPEERDRLLGMVTGEDDKKRDEKIKELEAEIASGKKASMKKGGKVSSASKRADGCCIRGKTRA